jgi:hypothetical protein
MVTVFRVFFETCCASKHYGRKNKNRSGEKSFVSHKLTLNQWGLRKIYNFNRDAEKVNYQLSAIFERKLAKSQG